LVESFLQNEDTFLPYYMVSHPIQQKST